MRVGRKWPLDYKKGMATYAKRTYIIAHAQAVASVPPRSTPRDRVAKGLDKKSDLRVQTTEYRIEGRAKQRPNDSLAAPIQK